MSENKPLTVMLVAGEASGDQHAANLFVELKKKRPEIHGIGMGGAKMRAAGIDIRYDSSAIAVIGVVEVIKHYAEIRRALTQMQRLLAEERPDLLICVDYKEFNFKLAAYAKKIGVKVLFYVSPQVWAWRPGRVVKYGKVIDMMAVIFPFETAYYEAHDIPVQYVGHPSVDKVHPEYAKAQDLERFGLNPENPVVGILPGSRSQEVKRLLPPMVQAAEIIVDRFPQAQFILAQADSISDDLIDSYVATLPFPVKVIKQQTYDVVQCCDAVMTTSGTATLEIALLTIPMVITYKLTALTYLLGRMLVRTPFIGLPNIIAGKSIVKELIQGQATGPAIAAEICKILQDKHYAKQIKQALSQVKQILGEGGGSRNMARLADRMLKEQEVTRPN